MKLSSVNRAIVNSGTMEVAKATIKATPKIFDMFADQTYANKPVAICRELVANGIDAHIAAGIPHIPVEVTMPTELEPEFKVKDQGIGMTHDFVMGPFMAYTDGSTKDQSDDQIGGFGIGSKSPFAYCDQYTLRVVKDGILSVYTMFKDEEGIPSIGLQGQTTTDESNGVEVSFPVELDDMEDFQSAAQTALQYFFPLPTVHNGTLSSPDYSHVSSTGKWAMRPSSGALGVIMGGVRYPVNSDALPYSVRRNEKVAPLFDYGIDITLPIGSVDVAMSREGLSYTQKTFDGLTAALGAIVDEVAATFATLFDGYKTRWDAQVALWKELANLGGNSYTTTGRVGMLRSYAKYNGQKLEADINTAIKRKWDSNARIYVETPPAGFPAGAEVWSAYETGRSQRFPNPKFKALGSDVNSITPGAHEVVFLDDMEIAPKSRLRSRVEEYLALHHANRTKPALVLRSKSNQDDKSNKALLKFLGSPTVIKLSTLPEPARKARTLAAGGAMVVRPKVRMFTFTGNKDKWNNTITNFAPGRLKRGIVTEVPEADQPTKGILVTLKGWALPADFYKKMRTGLMKYDELHFVLPGDAAKLKDSKFKHFDAVFTQRFNKEKRKHPNLPTQLAIAEDANLKELFAKIQQMRRWLPATYAETTAFGKILKLYNENVATLTDELRAFAVNADIAAATVLPDGLDTAALAESFKTEHPFAQKVLNLVARSYRGFDADNTPLFVHNL